MLEKEIGTAYLESSGRSGSPRITKELNVRGIAVSKVLVARTMRRLHLKSIVRKCYRTTTDSSHRLPVAENILNRQFTVAGKNMAWVSDLTYIKTGQGWLYLTTVMDLFDRKMIGWAFSDNMKATHTTVAAFRMVATNRPIDHFSPFVFHSDRGVQYACEEFTTLLAGHNILQSMSRKGNCWDNAVAESFFKTLKTELVYHRKYQTRKEAELSIFEYIETFYNTKRRHSHLDNLTILEFQQSNKNSLKNAA